MFKLSVLLLLGFLSTQAVAMAQSSADKGRTLYLSYGCALCHGLQADGHGINGQHLLPPPADLHDPKDYRHGLDADSIRRSIQYGIKEDNSIMPAFEHIPTDEMNEIIAYLQSLQKGK